MNPSGPMDKYLNALGPALATFEAAMQDVDLNNPDSARTYARGMQELQLHNWAAGMAATKRHGLLKKVMEECR